MTGAPVPRRPLKRVFDLCLIVPAVVVLAPLLAGIALAIKMEGWIRRRPAPVLYRETRISRGRPIAITKFRTLRADVDPSKSADGIKSMEGQENLTAVGRVLQGRYLDELPQVFHILVGQMSLVGPRPVQPHIYENEVRGGVDVRTWLPAGLTGQFQVEKGIGDFRKRRISLDQEYFEKYRTCGHLELLVHDVRLLLRTVRTLLRGGGW